MQDPRNSRAFSEAALRDLLANYEILETSVRPIARLYYTRFDELKKAGFTEVQAFTLVLNRGLE